ncbi:MAG: NfeD family protein [Pseudomonadota bacterium]
MDIFDFLNDISPWWWVAAALALGAIEILTFSFFLIWPALAALLVAIFMWMSPGMSGATQIFWFAILSVVLTLAGRYWVMTNKPTSDNPPLNNRAAALIGRQAVLLDGLTGRGVGNVEVDGIRWRARLAVDEPAAEAGQSLSITDTEGMVLILTR